MKTWSICTFMNEVEVLEIRLAEQWPEVDVFVICEATETHMRAPREPVFKPELFEEWGHRIRYLRCEFPEQLAPGWACENYQRNYLGWGLDGLQPDDLVIVSDLDEILSAETIRGFKSGALRTPTFVSMPIHPYRLDWRWPGVEDGWGRCTVIRGKHLTQRGSGFWDGVHFAVEGLVTPSLIGEYGWHFSYIGDEEKILAKADSIADEWVKGLAGFEDARAAIRNGVDVFGRTYRQAEPVALDRLPQHVQEHRDRFAHILREDGRRVR